jgi:sorting nexin-8
LFRNHPVIKEDGLLATFLSEPSFENWRKHTAVSLEEESASRHVDRIEEITVPSDLEDKLAYVQHIYHSNRSFKGFEVLCGGRSIH